MATKTHLKCQTAKCQMLNNNNTIFHWKNWIELILFGFCFWTFKYYSITSHHRAMSLVSLNKWANWIFFLFLTEEASWIEKRSKRDKRNETIRLIIILQVFFFFPCVPFWIFVCIEICHKLSNWIEWDGWISAYGWILWNVNLCIGLCCTAHKFV